MTALTLTSLALSLTVLGHRLPDHVVERAVQVTVYPQRIEIVYQIGFNEVTLAEQLRGLAPDVPVPDSPEQMLDVYRQHILPRLAERLEVQLDDKPVIVEPREARRATLHHAQLECVLEVPLSPDDPPVSLKVHDQNFADEAGAHRMAAKGREGPRLFSSTVPPILARVAQVPDDELTDEQRESRRWIEAEIRWPASQDLAAHGSGQPDPSEEPAAEPRATTPVSPGEAHAEASSPTSGSLDAMPPPPAVERTRPNGRESFWGPMDGRLVLVVIGAICLLIGGGFLLVQQKKQRGVTP